MCTIIVSITLNYYQLFEIAVIAELLKNSIEKEEFAAIVAEVFSEEIKSPNIRNDYLGLRVHKLTGRDTIGKLHNILKKYRLRERKEFESACGLFFMASYDVEHLDKGKLVVKRLLANGYKFKLDLSNLLDVSIPYHQFNEILGEYETLSTPRQNRAKASTGKSLFVEDIGDLETPEGIEQSSISKHIANYIPPIAKITSSSWMPQFSNRDDTASMDFGVNFYSAHRIHEGEEFVYGAVRAYISISGSNITISDDTYRTEYRGEEYIRHQGATGEWSVVNYHDHNGFLHGSCIPIPLFDVHTKEAANASVEVMVYARKSELVLKLTDSEKDQAVRIETETDDNQKAILISRLFGIYLNKINGFDTEHILLSKTRLPF